MDQDLSSIGGVIALTVLVVSQIKMWLSETPYVRRVPLLVVALAIASVLTCLAHVAGYLTGNLGHLICQVILSALGSSGVYSLWSGSSLQSLQDSAKPKTVGTPIDEKQQLHEQAMGFVGKNIVPVLALALLMTGCSSDSLIRCYQAKDGYASTLETVERLRDLGVIPQSAVNESKPYRVAAKSALDAWESAAKAHQPTQSYEDAFRDAAAIVRMMLDAYAPKPTTRPAEGDGHATYDSRRRVGDNPAHSQPRGYGRSGESGHYARRVESRERSDLGCGLQA